MTSLSLKEFCLFVSTSFDVPAPFERRRVLLEEMKNLGEKKIDCFNCNGTCCSFSSNSMKVTPLEALELMTYLFESQEDMGALKIHLEETVRSYRLDHEISLGKKSNAHLRKTYTCPFYQPGPKGCRIKKEYKPYGCLGFNPRTAGESGSQCAADISLLEKREALNSERERAACLFIQQELKLDWDKMDLPRALLKLCDIFALDKATV